jgi:alpha-galactosidase/6-phospho-beta-glucosidase family protein
MTAKITIVGGGSTHWTPKLMVDFANTPPLTDAQVVLYDVDPESLPPALKVAEHVAERRGIALTTRATTDIDDALDGVEFVIAAFSVGGFTSMRHDIEIPARYGVRQTVGDSVGPGGISRALRSVPVIVEVARAMERRCPDALLVNVSNPLTALCRAVTSETTITTVGLCAEIVGLKFVLSLLFDVNFASIDPVVAGVNHLPLVTALRVGDRDGFAMLREVLDGADQAGDTVETVDLSKPLWMDPPGPMHYVMGDPERGWTKSDILTNNRVKFELFRRFGVLPGSSDTHVVEFFPGFVTATSDYGRDWGAHHYGMHGHRSDKADDDVAMAALLSAEKIPTWPSGEFVAPLLEGLVTGKDQTLPGNIPNRGQVENLPPDVVVECMVVAGADGVRARDRAVVPSFLGEHLRRVSASQELTVEAAISGDRTTALEAMLADPVAGSLPYEHVVAMTDELLAATRPWLAQFTDLG